MHKINVWHEYSKSLPVLFYRCFHQQFCTLISYNSSTKCKAVYDFLITLALCLKHFSSFWFKSSEFLTRVFLLFTEDMSMRILCPRNSSKSSPSTKQSKSDSCESSHFIIEWSIIRESMTLSHNYLEISSISICKLMHEF